MGIETACFGLEAAIHLVVVCHEDPWHILLEVLSIEDASARLHGLLDVPLCQACRHDDLFVVLGSRTCYHERSWKSS